MDTELYDEFGNYIGPELDSDEESESEEEEEQVNQYDEEEVILSACDSVFLTSSFFIESKF